MYPKMSSSTPAATRSRTTQSKKMMEFPASSDILVPKLAPHLVSLVAHPTGQFVASSIVDSVTDGAAVLSAALFPGGFGDTEVLEVIIEKVKESPVLCSLLKSAMTDDDIKDAIVEHVIQSVDSLVSLEKAAEGEDEEAETSFGPATDVQTKKQESEPTGRHNFLLAACFEHGTPEQQASLFNALVKHLPQLVATKSQNAVAVEMVRRLDSNSRSIIYKVLTTDEEGKTLPLAKVAADVRRSMVLRALIEARSEVIPDADMKKLLSEATALADDPVATIVLQRVLEYGTDAMRASLFASTTPHIRTLALHPIGTYFIQQLIESIDDDKKRGEIGHLVVKAVGDLKEGLSVAAGSRVMQKVIAYVEDKDIRSFVKSLTGFDSDDHVQLTDEEKLAKGEEVKTMNKRERKDNVGSVSGDALIHFALHPHACFVVQALLRETKRRGMDSSRKALMNELKPHVFDLAVSPWAGRVVLDTMLTTGSEDLKNAIRNVVFMKAEGWLTETSDRSQRRGAADPTTRKALRGEHISGSDDRANKKHRSEKPRESKPAEAPAAAQKPKKKVFRSLKK
eukprot:GDKJ01031140.1.p1 GENE.GDKJ01031140.1~~GDKJ01031140.1.p1  ORF type:complete len:567 (+),score=58.00 GDKJ01031140.1:74-1774(+)